MSQEQEPKQAHQDGAIYSPWFPYTGDDPDPWSRVSSALNVVGYIPRPDPAPHASWDGYMVVEKDGALMRYPMRILRIRKARR